MDKERLQDLLVGKIIDEADLSHGTVRLFFTDGTVFQREKTCEGEIVASLFDKKGQVIVSAKI